MKLKINSNTENFFGSDYELKGELSIENCLSTFDENINKVETYIQDKEV